MVDDPREYTHARLPVRWWCHMASDGDYEELHRFAERLGIPRTRFQGDHYDLPPHLRERALALGAEAVPTTELTARMAGPRGGHAERRPRRRTGRRRRPRSSASRRGWPAWRHPRGDRPRT